MTSDHRMGYSPAMREDFAEPEAWDYYPRFPLGTPARMRGLWDVEAAEGCGTSSGPVVRRIVNGGCMTKGDVDGALADLQDKPAAVEAAESLLVTVGRGCADRVAQRVNAGLPISDAAMWPFVQQQHGLPMLSGHALHEHLLLGRGEPQAVEAMRAQAEQHRLSCVKAMEQQKAAEQAAMWSQQMYSDEKVKA